MTKSITKPTFIILLVLSFISFASIAFGLTLDTRTSGSSYYESVNHYTALDAVDDTATSDAIEIAGAKKAQVYFAYSNAAGAGNGTSTFSVEVSPNGTDWYDYNKLISNVANTNAQEVTRVATVEQSATTSALYAVDLEHDTFRNMRCVAALEATTTAKTATCEVTVEF